MTPINYDDPNDHRNYDNGPDLALPPITALGNGMTYHDFDYVGYMTRDNLKSSNRSSRFQTINYSPKTAKQPKKSVATAVSPRIISGVTRSDNHGTRKLSKPKAKLPEIVKRGPININRNNQKKVVGLSIQKQEEPKKFVKKRASLESNRRAQRSNARNAILRAQHLEVPSKKTPEVKGLAYRMPDRQASVQPRANQKASLSSRGSSLSPIRKNNALKPLINNRAWIPGGHPNSVGRNKLASVGKAVNLMYHDSTQLAPNASVSRLSHHVN